MREHVDLPTLDALNDEWRQHPPVQRYVHPDVFETYAAYGQERGIPHVFAAPLVRSSYNAKDVFEALMRREHAGEG